MEARALEGTWHLTGWEIVQPDGAVTYPFGPDATGVIVYSGDGTMSAAIARAGRAPFAGGNPRRASEHERASAADSYFHYAGPYHVTEEEGRPLVVHRVTHALNPGFVGTEQRRFIDLDGDNLTLSAREALPDGRHRDHRLIWRR
ncbi:MAG: lipocalin-like domain-containing protein [Pararhodobacter sp.]|nr:lipocalin-like domain-containing protein [Pararhodobacter sp.]